MSERSRGALLAGGALVLLGFVWASLDKRVREQGSGASSVHSDGGEQDPPAAGDHAGSPSSTTSDPASELGAQAVDPPASREELGEPERPDPHAGVDFEEPRPGPEAELHDAESEREAALGAGEKAEQSWRLQGALSTRAAALRERAEAARAGGDLEEAARLEQILSRLEQRAELLGDTAEALDAEAVSEPEAPAPAHDDAHAHDHASE